MTQWSYTYFTITIIGTYVMHITSIPLDNPYKVDLPVYNDPQEYEPLDPEISKPMERANSIAPSNTGSIVSRFINNRVRAYGDAVSHQISNIGLTRSNRFVSFVPPVQKGLFDDPPRKTDNVIFDVESIPSRGQSIKENIQNIVAGILQPKPVVDTIKENEKYGNTGRFAGASRAIVNGAESISNVVNAVLDAPLNALKSITRSASERLNNLGGHIVGLK